MPPDARALLILLRASDSAAALRRLLDRFGDADAALAATASAWCEAGFGAAAIAALDRPDLRRITADLDWLDGADRHLIGWHDPDYPGLLRRGACPPAALFVCGDPAWLWHPQIAVVGSRQPSAGGRDTAAFFAADLAASGWVVTSGLAQGIDAAAHRAALTRGGTVAVVGTGLDLCYPRGHAALMVEIAGRGAVVSEHPPGTPPLRQHFPARNRLIAELSLATLVIEAAEQSGALITARLAAEAGREVFAVPGSIHNPKARGCHRLIRQGAALVERPEEVVAGLTSVVAELTEALRGRLAAVPPTASATACQQPPDALQQRIWQALDFDPVNLDQLVERTGLTVAELAPMLLLMELEGRVVAEHGRYARRP